MAYFIGILEEFYQEDDLTECFLCVICSNPCVVHVLYQNVHQSYRFLGFFNPYEMLGHSIPTFFLFLHY
jgi:hypothetical protein